jgi:tetratricopeptide (TPR) repeat protein
MANIFLSYDREDVARARPIAALLERTGHSVWWDRQIKAGGEFGAEIEEALNAADKVVVLWSERSVKSAWVRDEAAVGRDSGRLVPARLDGTLPPLGFRQFQTIDLSTWSGRSNARQVRDLLEAIGIAPSSRPVDPPAPPQRRSAPELKWRWRIVALAALLLSAVVAGWWWTDGVSARAPTVAIESSTNSPLSNEVARQLAVRLGELQSTQSNSFKLISGPARADLRLQVNAADTAAMLRRDVTVLSGSDGAILWSASLQQPPANADQLTEQVTLTSQRVLSCALDALSDRKDRIDASTLKLYLGGCSRLEDVYGNDQYNPELEKIFDKVVASAPHFSGAWAKLLQIEAEVAAQPDPPAPLLLKLRKHIDAVEALGADVGELYVAKAALLPADNFLGKFALYDEGIKADPDNPLLYQVRSYETQRVGRMNDMVADAARAMQLDPLSPALAENYASALAYSGQTDAGYVQLRKAEAAWPGAANLRYARFRLDLRFGDPKEALALYRSGIGTAASDTAMESFIEARIDPTAANVQKAIDAERIQYAGEPRYIAGLLQVLGQFGRTDEAIDLMLHYNRPDATGYNADTFFRPAMRDIWRDPRSIAAAARMGLLRYWEKSGHWPDFCADPTLPYECTKEAAKYRV